ncbi:MAG: glutathione S-transferase family protein [Hyphomonadaceae bacterium]|nr:glutathione S-transferase family protein [Hyphomonadaceae bacterium]
MIRITNFARGARGLRLAWQCEEMGLAYETAFVGYPPPAEYLAKNPLGNVPFLEDEGGVAINESAAIMLFLANRYGPTPLLPRAPALNARVTQLTVYAEATFGAGANTLMVAHFGAPDAEKKNWSVRMQEEAAERSLAYLVNVLGGGAFLVGDDLTLADIAIATGLGMYKGALGKELPQQLVDWRAKLAERPAYQRAAQRTQG